MQFHERLYALRKKSGMTQIELAERLDVSRQAISRWEMGTAKPDIDNLIALSELYKVTIDLLLKGDGVEVSSDEENAKSVESAQEKKHNTWLGLMLALYIVAFAIIAIANLDPVGATVTAGIFVAVIWVIKLLVCWIIQMYRN